MTIRPLIKMWFPKQRPILILILVLMTTIVHADPENFMVGGLTFVRPSEWPWVWNEKLANDGNLLSIPGLNSSGTAAVFFRGFTDADGTPDERINFWRAREFRESSHPVKVQTETKTIATFRIVYVEMEGVPLRGSGEFTLFAAIVSTKEGRVVARMSGRKNVVDNSKAIFTKMVEEAVKEKESDESDLQK